jgi:hypothetical protein
MDLCFFLPGWPLIRSVPPPPITFTFVVAQDLPAGTIATVILQPPAYSASTPTVIP